MLRNTDLYTKGENSVFYNSWNRMLNRCYSPSVLKTQPYYKDCSVCESWFAFSHFKEWMEKQDYEYKVLDKDLLGDGKLYSPKTCAFILPETNTFLTDRKNFRGELPIGVHKHSSGKYQARCGNLKGGRVHLGTFSCPNEAHIAWKTHKHKLALILSEQESDTRVRHALRIKYL